MLCNISRPSFNCSTTKLGRQLLRLLQYYIPSAPNALIGDLRKRALSRPNLWENWEGVAPRG